MSSIADIEKFCRIFCPVFDTVIIKWKGYLESALMLSPIPEDYGENFFGEMFAGQGYIVTSDKTNKGWPVALSWANPLPREISYFLATKALPLIKAGRLVVLPAPLVGCTQSAIGWTDNLLVDNMLGGVVDIPILLESEDRNSGKCSQKVLDIANSYILHFAL